MNYLYGIKNCDTIKKAKKWLETNKIEFHFHDYRADGIEQKWLEEIEAQLGWESLLNKRGTTFRNLPDEIKENLAKDTAIQVMLENPAIIKRPLLVKNKTLLLGFKAEQYEDLFNS